MHNSVQIKFKTHIHAGHTPDSI